MDTDDDFETHSYSFSGLDNVLARFAEQISGATGIPLVRLFGQSPSGFNTGDADLANYYDNIATQQSRRLKQPLRKLFEIAHQSALGKPLPDDFSFAFNPLWQMSDMDKSTVAVNMINALNAAQDGGMLSMKAAMSSLRDLSDVISIGSTITDEDINHAEDEPPPRLSAVHAATVKTGGNPISNEPE